MTPIKPGFQSKVGMRMYRKPDRTLLCIIYLLILFKTPDNTTFFKCPDMFRHRPP